MYLYTFFFLLASVKEDDFCSRGCGSCAVSKLNVERSFQKKCNMANKSSPVGGGWEREHAHVFNFAAAYVYEFSSPIKGLTVRRTRSDRSLCPRVHAFKSRCQFLSTVFIHPPAHHSLIALSSRTRSRRQKDREREREREREFEWEGEPALDFTSLFPHHARQRSPQRSKSPMLTVRVSLWLLARTPFPCRDAERQCNWFRR
jgi:hypothetical protein